MSNDSGGRVGRLVTFAVVLAGLFASAYSLGERLPGHEHSSGGTDDHSGMDHSAPVEPALAAGVDAGYRLVESLDATDGAIHRFHLEDSDGDHVVDFDLVHGALLHVVMVRPDLSRFFHVHPEIRGDGSFDVMLPDTGLWHVVFESTPSGNDGEAVIVSTDLTDGTATDSTELPPAVDTATVVGADGTELVVTRTIGTHGLTFEVTDAAGTPVDGLEPYLGQPAHLVLFRSSDLAYAHLHPMSQFGDPTISFGGILPTGTTYRAYLQFGWAGEIVTVAFTLST